LEQLGSSISKSKILSFNPNASMLVRITSPYENFRPPEKVDFFVFSDFWYNFNERKRNLNVQRRDEDGQHVECNFTR
jgi:hypothetical protein